MRIAVTVDSEHDSTDVLVDCGDAATVGEVEGSLHQHLGTRVTVPGRTHSPVARTLVNGARLGCRDRDAMPRPGGWQVHVVSGPDSGVVWELHEGEHVVGRSGGIWWNDPAMSRRHVAIYVGIAAVEVMDLGSRHGTSIDGTPCPRGNRLLWPIGATLEVGNSVAVLREPPIPDGLWEDASPGWRRLLRPPRVLPRLDLPVVAIPEPVPEPGRRRLPAVAIAIPLVLGVVIAAMFRRPEYLLFALASPLMLLTNHAVGRVGTARTHRAKKADRAAEIEAAERQVVAAIEDETAALRDQQPDAAATLLTSLLPGRRLWERRRGDHDFLRVRIGSADQTSRVQITGGAPSDRVARLVPQCVDLASSSVVGITGEEEVSDGVLRWLLAQLVAHQAPRDLALVFLGVGAGDDWEWLRWLPHLRPSFGDECSAMVGIDPPAIGCRVAALRDLIRLRQSKCAADRTLSPADFATVVVVVRGYRGVSRLVNLQDVAGEGPRVGVYLLCTAPVDGELPEGTRLVISASQSNAAVGFATGAAEHRMESARLEQVSVRWAERFARGLAPFQDASGEGGGAIHEVASLLELLKCDLRPGEIGARWRAHPRSTRVMLGVGSNGPLSLDLKTDGPHALIAGMTGSGKTELLQTLIASLALVNHPQWLNFVLIDYKGDSAFRELARLPHTVGKVNDLRPHLVERALVSLRAELDRRKNILAAAAVKDIDDYHDLLQREPHQATLPRLVLVIDEFAELAKELPEFIEGLVSTAQVGRSLGLHLILATQRPGGVLSAAIRANTNIRIALRVADAVDSADVVGVVDASLVPATSPGHGYLKLGAKPVIGFQAARVLNCVVGEQRPTHPPFVASLRWADVGGIPPRRADTPTDEVSDLAALVECIAAESRAERVMPQRRPWLDPLPTTLPWSRRERATPVGRLPPLGFGLSDEPAQQRQEAAGFDLDRDGHLYFIGAPRSGRSQALRVVAAAIAELVDPGELHVYGLDCGDGALSQIATMPHCGAVVTRQEPERAGRLLARLTSELDRRLRLGVEAARGETPNPPPRLLLMLDRWEGFTSTFGEVSEQLDAVTRLLREGSSAGIHLVLTGDRTLLTNARMSAMTEAKYVLRLAEKGDYLLAGLNPRQIGPEMPPGRCIGPGGRETQVFLLDDEPACSSHGSGPRPFRIDPLPARVGLTEAIDLLPPGATLPAPIVGVGGDELTAFAPDMERSTCFAVIGPPRSGRSSVLAGAVRSATMTGAEVLVIAPRPSDLTHVDGSPGVLAVISDDVTQGAVEWALAQRASGRVLLVVDDVDELRAPPIDDLLLSVTRGRLPGLFLMVAGSSAGIGYGFSGWQAQLRKASQGLLLSPRSLGDGDLVGARLTRAVVGGPIRPGTGLLHSGSGVVTPVATLMPTVNRR